MTPHALIQTMTADGLHLSITLAGRIRAAGKQATVLHWLPVLKTRKADILSALAPPDIQDFTEDMEERAAIMEFDGGMTRREAEAAAFENRNKQK